MVREFASDDLDDREFPDEDDNGDEAEWIQCRECGAEVYEDAVQCPCCGNYITSDTSVWVGRPLWWIGLAVLGIIAVIFAFSVSF